MTLVNDILTKDEKQQIEVYQQSMHRAWTKRGVDKYFDKIMAIIEQAEKRQGRQDRIKQVERKIYTTRGVRIVKEPDNISATYE